MQIAATNYAVVIVSTLVATSAHAFGDAIEIGGHLGGSVTNIVRWGGCSDSDACSLFSIPGHVGVGPLVGAYARYPASRHIRLEGELTYALKGYDSGSVVHFHYLEVPLLIRYTSDETASHTRAFVHGGLAPAVLLFCHQSGVAFDNDLHTSFPYSNVCDEGPVVDRTPWRFDLGAALGVGIGWNLGFGVVELELRYTRSLLDIERERGGRTTNHAFSILVGMGTALGD